MYQGKVMSASEENLDQVKGKAVYRGTCIY